MGKAAYSPEFKKSAVALVTEQKYTPQDAAKNLGVNPHTLKYWLRRYGRGAPTRCSRRICSGGTPSWSGRTPGCGWSGTF